MNDSLQLFGHAADALARGDWDALARSCDPASLTLFQRQELENLERRRLEPDWTVEDILRNNPEMPREVAEYQFRQSLRQREMDRDLGSSFPGVSTLEELRAMEPTAFFATWLRGRSPEHQARLAVADASIPEEMRQSVLASAGFRHRLVPLGVVYDGERLAHVVYLREYPPPPGSEEVGDKEHESYTAWREELSAKERALRDDLAGREWMLVVSCRKQPDGSWRFLAGYDFLHMGHYMVGLSV